MTTLPELYREVAAYLGKEPRSEREERRQVFRDGDHLVCTCDLTGRFIHHGPGLFSEEVDNVVWSRDAIGVPDLSFKGINKFRGRWCGTLPS